VMFGDVRLGALLIREHEHKFSVLVPEFLVELAGDEELQEILIAADLARSSPTVDEHADLLVLAKAMADAGADTAVVVDAATGTPVGLVTKARVGLALVDWYASRPADPARA